VAFAGKRGGEGRGRRGWRTQGEGEGEHWQAVALAAPADCRLRGLQATALEQALCRCPLACQRVGNYFRNHATANG